VNTLYLIFATLSKAGIQKYLLRTWNSLDPRSPIGVEDKLHGDDMCSEQAGAIIEHYKQPRSVYNQFRRCSMIKKISDGKFLRQVSK